MNRFLLAMVIVAMVATSAQATAHIWWQMDAGPAGAVAVGGQGQTLVIIGTTGSYDLSIWIATDAALATQGTTGYRNNIWRGDGGLTMTSDPMAGLLNPLGWVGPAGFTAGSQNSGDYLIGNWGRARNAGAVTISASNSPLKIYTLTISVATPGEHDIYQTVGAGGYGWLPLIPTTLNQVVFGPNPPVHGGTAVDNHPTGLLPVVRFPEPATLLLLALGGAAVTKRRARVI